MQVFRQDGALHAGGNQGSVRAAAGNLVQAFLHAQQGQRGHAGQGGGQLIYGAGDVGAVAEVGEKAAVQHGGGVQRLGGQQQAAGHVQAQAAHKALQPALVQVQAQLHRGHAHARLRAAHAKVAGQGQIGAAAKSAALHGGDGDGAAGGQRVHHVAKAVARARVGGQLGQVVPAAKVLARALEDEHAHAVGGVDFAQVGAQRGDVFGREFVGRFRALEGDAGDGAADVKAGRGHVLVSLCF